MITPPTETFVTTVEDSRRWEHLATRPGDIVVCTPPKSGTTWMQGILTSLVFADSDIPSLAEASIWPEARWRQIDDVVDMMDAMPRRRLIKSHSPGTAIPFDDDLEYVVVYRDGRDALASWANHRRSMKPEVIAMLNELAAPDGVAPIPPEWSGDMNVLMDEWESFCSPTIHLASWWPRRESSNVQFVHYNDLQADLDGEMRRLADHLAITVDEHRWPVVVDRCGLSEMRDAARSDLADGAFIGGADAFFYKGTNGRWRDMLDEDHLARYEQNVAEHLTPDAAAWLEHGSLRLGARPGGQ